MIDWADISEAIGQKDGSMAKITGATPVFGGDINQSFAITIGDKKYFLKVNDASMKTMLVAEAKGLEEISNTHSIIVPEVIFVGKGQKHSFLMMQYMDFRPLYTKTYEKLGEAIAAMHTHKNEYFGWQMDNTIGKTPQINTPSRTWKDFWIQFRLYPQLKMAKDKGYEIMSQTDIEKYIYRIDHILSSHHPHPSPVHGDLWRGNINSTHDGIPVIYDPAFYYGDREVDIAMTELFGKLDSGFYDAYQHHYPLLPGYTERRSIYNLYHLLNHLNLFGGGYLGMVQSEMKSFL